MTRKKVLVLGGNFGGLTAAIAIKHELHGDVDVTVVSASDRFLFNPSLIWVPFGKRKAEDITFPLDPTFDQHGVELRPRRGDRARPARQARHHHGRHVRLRLPGHRDRLPEPVRRDPRPRP